jgi:transglutaminase-like putative cysteine protease
MSIFKLIPLAIQILKPTLTSSLGVFYKALTEPAWVISVLSQAMHKPDEKKDEKLPYEIPKYESNMRYCNSDDSYLSPSKFIQSDAPEIIALANSLGAFQKSDWDYANSAFRWVRENISFRVQQPDQSALGTLKTGKATCIGKMHLLAALLKCGGMPIRFRIDTIRTEQNLVVFAEDIYSKSEMNEIIRSSTDFINNFPHQLLEVKIGDRWILGEPSVNPELAASLGYPIPKLGDDPSLSWVGGYGGNYIYLDKFPNLIMGFMNLGFKLYVKLLPGVAYTTDEGLKEMEEKGRNILKQYGSIEKYDKEKRSKKAHEVTAMELSSMLKDI